MSLGLTQSTSTIVVSAAARKGTYMRRFYQHVASLICGSLLCFKADQERCHSSVIHHVMQLCTYAQCPLPSAGRREGLLASYSGTMAIRRTWLSGATWRQVYRLHTCSIQTYAHALSRSPQPRVPERTWQVSQANAAPRSSSLHQLAITDPPLCFVKPQGTSRR